MGSLFATLYVVPAAVGLLIFWAIWRLIRLADLPLAVRRTVFVVIGTLLLAPMLVPVATIMTAWVPHGLLLTSPDPGYYVYLARFVVPSFVITAAVFGLLAWWRIKADTARLRIDWTTFALPLLVTALTVGLYRYGFPDTEVPNGVSAARIEKVYGTGLDHVIAMLAIDDVARRRLEIERLRDVFRQDPAVLLVTVDAGSQGQVYAETFHYAEDQQGPSSKTCWGGVASGQSRLQRCRWSYGTLRKRDVVWYSRESVQGEERVTVTIGFDTGGLLDRLGH